tara:strand:+ start:512 stop:1675 length:1164 start_codon:yes stop_codon:yes gene_type:complete
MQNVLLGNKKGLVFPVLCNGVIKVGYRDNVPDVSNNDDASDDVPFGIWGHAGSFTLDAIITPYEINGSGVTSSSVKNSQKAFPFGGAESNKNLFHTSNAGSDKIRATHKMTLFHSTKLKVYLVNDTSFHLDSPNYITHSKNNPSSYKVEVQITTGTGTTTLTSGVLIKPSITQPFTYDDFTAGHAFNSQGKHTHSKIETLGGGAHGGSTTFTSGTNPASNIYHINQRLYTRSGFDMISIGTVTALSGTTVTLSGTPASSLNSETIYQDAPKEATYVDDSFHVGVTFDNITKKLSILFNGIVVKTTTHPDDNDFQLDSEDLFIGANGTSSYANSSSIPSNFGRTNEQFYGVFHEMCFTNILTSAFNNGILEPNFKNTLLFLTFEEVDE